MTSVEDLYSEYTEEAAVEEAKTFRRPFFKPEFGNNLIRILPIPIDMKTKQRTRSSPWVVTYEHQVKFPTGFLRIACPRLMGDGQPCVLCAISDDFRSKKKAKDDPNDKMAQNFGPRMHTYIELISRKEEDLARGVLLWDSGKKIREDLNRLRRDQLVGRDDYTHPRTGTDLVVHKKKTGDGVMNVEYDVQFMRNSSPLAKTDDQMIQWLLPENRVDFTEKLAVPTSERVQERLQQFKDAVRQLRENPEEGVRKLREAEEQRAAQKQGMPDATGDDVPGGDSGEVIGGDYVPPPGDNDIPF